METSKKEKTSNQEKTQYNEIHLNWRDFMALFF